jgi:hypothetical protein
MRGHEYIVRDGIDTGKEKKGTGPVLHILHDRLFVELFREHRFREGNLR